MLNFCPVSLSFSVIKNKNFGTYQEAQVLDGISKWEYTEQFLITMHEKCGLWNFPNYNYEPK